MYEIFTEKPEMAEKAMEAKFMPNTVLQFVIFVGVFVVAQVIQALLGGIILVLTNLDNLGAFLNTTNEASLMNNSTFLLTSLFITVFVTILAVIYCRFIERRSLYSMGFTKQNAFKQYFMGLFIGFVMFGASILICMLTGTLKFNGYILSGGALIIVIFFLGFFFQGMSEEVLLRSYLMISLTTKRSIMFAVIANSVIFSAMHLLNSGITALSVVNLTLFGIFASLYTLRTNNIWGICAIHTMWNFVQGNIFGILVSGMSVGASVFSFTPTAEGSLINGGSFGLEGGLAVTIVLVASTALVIMLKRQKNEPTSIQEVGS